MRPHPRSLAQAVSWMLEKRDAFTVLLDEFLDEFYTEETSLARQAMIDEEPARIGDERDDAYIGAVGEHLAHRWGLLIPEWTDQPWRQVSEPWFVGSMGKGLSGLLLVESPIAFRRRRIFTEAEPLRRARMPAGDPVQRFGPSSGAIHADVPAVRPVSDHNPASSLYFAYGSNLHMDDMAIRCPGSAPIRRLTLKDWVLEFRFYADIVPSPGKIVEGALYSVTPTDVAALDEYEGLSEGLYRRQTIVLKETQEEIFFYVMNRGDITMPSVSYLNVIKTGFANWHIPPDTLNDAVGRADKELEIERIRG